MVTYAIIFVLLLVTELAYFKIADKFNIIDKPNERSSHSTLVLRGGGIIFLIGAWLWFAYLWMENGSVNALEHLPFIIGLTMVAGVSFVDDIHTLPDIARLVVQFTAMALMLYNLGILQPELWWVVIIALIVCVGITNAYNFMDGINGITGGYSIAVLLPLMVMNGLCGLNCLEGHTIHFVSSSFLNVALISVVVFCIFNFREKGKAKCFAGDVGSIGMAFLLIFALGKLILASGDFTYIVFFAVYGVDTVLTICHRAMLHENLGEAHRKHAYQIMTNELKASHVAISSLYMVIQLIISMGMILIPNTAICHWGYLVGVVLVLAIVYVLFMKKYYHLHEEYLASLIK